MRKFWLALICASAIDSLAQVPNALTPLLRNPANGHEYYLLDSANWTDSETAAKQWGGHLATIRNQAEQDWILSTYGAYGGQQRLLWIGFNDIDEVLVFEWASGEPVTFLNWANGEPNNASGDERFVALYYPNFNQPGAWNDWNARTTDPIGLPFNGVVEFIPQLSFFPMANGDLEIAWPRVLADYNLEATSDLSQPFTTFTHPRLVDPEKGANIATISPAEAQMFFRLRKFE
jgi:hypothetical protein